MLIQWVKEQKYEMIIVIQVVQTDSEMIIVIQVVQTRKW